MSDQSEAASCRRRMEELFVYDAEKRTLTIRVSYPYVVDLDKAATREELMEWVLDLCNISWMNTDYLREFIERVYRINGWERCRL